MPDKEFLLANKARELLIYTSRATRITTDDVSARDVRSIVAKIAALDDIREVKAACLKIEKTLTRNSGEGFSKSAFRLYGQDMRDLAKEIVRDVFSANNRNFQTDYDGRLKAIDKVLDDCSMLQEYVAICTDAHIISVRKAGVFTAKIRDVRNMTVAWKRSDSSRAARIRESQADEKRKKDMAMVRKACSQALSGK